MTNYISIRHKKNLRIQENKWDNRAANFIAALACMIIVFSATTWNPHGYLSHNSHWVAASYDLPWLAVVPAVFCGIKAKQYEKYQEDKDLRSLLPWNWE